MFKTVRKAYIKMTKHKSHKVKNLTFNLKILYD